MRTETIDTMIRHFKGIVAALEKEKNKAPRVFTFRGKPLVDCTDDEILEAFMVDLEDLTIWDIEKKETLEKEINKRNLNEIRIEKVKRFLDQRA